MTTPTRTETEHGELQDVLVDILHPRLGTCAVHGLVRLKGGYSREMWSFNAVTAEGKTIPLVLCADTPHGVVGGGSQALTRVKEAALLHELHKQGAPVPDALWSGGAGGPLGRPFLIMERRPGTAAVGPMHRDPWYIEHRRLLGRQFAEMLAMIHSVTVPERVLGRRPAPQDAAPQALKQWRSELRATPDAISPINSRAIHWLEKHPPSPPKQVTLVHGDYRTGNILHHHEAGPNVDSDGLQTILDWEMAHYGDPLEDVAWAQLVCWRLGTDRVGGLVDLGKWPELYGLAAGTVVDVVSLRWWEVLGSIKMACLVCRAATVVDEVRERRLLYRLFEDLGREVARVIP